MQTGGERPKWRGEEEGKETTTKKKKKRQEKFESADSLVPTAGGGHCFNPPTCELKESDSRPR